MRHFKTLALRSSATLALLGALSLTAQAQVTIEEDTSDQILTSTSGDVTVGSDTTNVTVTIDAPRSGIILDSDNAVNLIGNITAANIDNVTGVEIQGDNEGSYTQSGDIRLIEDFTVEDTDGDGLPEGAFAQGTGRTGILISGASPFQGNVELASTSIIEIEGNDSFGINLTNTPMMTDGFTGDLTTSGQIGIIGDRSTGINIDSGVTGNVTNEGSIAFLGEDAQGIAIAGDISGAFESNGNLSTLSRLSNRPIFTGDTGVTGRQDLTAEDVQETGSAISIAGNVTNGVFLSEVAAETSEAEDGTITTITAARESTITHLGSAPAVRIEGAVPIEGSDTVGPSTIGLINQITDPDDENFDESLQFGFVNQGEITTNGRFDDVDATAIFAANTEILGGIVNEGNLSATTFLGATNSELSDGTAAARAIVLGTEATTPAINNSGTINVTSNEAFDEVFFDRDNIPAPRSLLAVGIDIEEGADVGTVTNSGIITASLTGRLGDAVGVRDQSGSVTEFVNNGFILTSGNTSDPLELEDTNFNTTAVDFSSSTTDIQINQFVAEEVGVTPIIQGDILLGTGNDTIETTAGSIVGDIDFGGGDDALNLSGSSAFLGEINNTDNLSLNVSEGSVASITSANTIQVSEATFDSTSTFRPTINGLTGESTTLNSNENITFENGASISPLLESIIGAEETTFTLATANNLTIADLDTLSSGVTPFLFNQSLSLNDPNTLVITLDLRDPNASVADGGLGLDSVQAAAFGTVVDGEVQSGPVLQALASVPSLGNAFSNITEANEFNTALNQILPEFSGAARQFVLANVDGAVGAVGSHLDTARRSPDKSGGAWLQEYFYFADRELAGNSEQYRGDGFGFAAGLDTAFGPFHAVGVSAGFSSTEVEDVLGTDDPLDVRTYQLGGYAALEKNGFDIDVYGGGGISEFEQDRRVNFGTFSGAASGEWEGVHANASLRAGYDFDIGEKFWVRPSVSLDYLYLNEYGRTETGTDGVRLRVDGRNSETAAASALLNFGAKFQGKRTWIRPSFRVGYRNEFISDPLETAFRFQGLTDTDGNVFDSELATLRSFAFPDEGILLGFTVAAGSEYSSIGFDLDSDIRDGFIRHTGRIVIRLLF